MQNRPVHHTIEPPTGQIHQLETRPGSHADRCLSDQLEGTGRVYISTLCTDRQMPTEHQSRTEQSTIVLVAPVWQNQAWFPILLDLMVELPFLLPHSNNLLLHPKGHPHSLVCTNRLRLAALKISGINIRQREFQKKPQPCYLQDGVQAPTLPTKLDGNSGVAGVREGRLILFRMKYNLS